MSMSNLVTNNRQPLILTLDTTSARASIALSQGAQLLGMLGITGNEKQSAHLLNEIDWLLKHLGYKITDIMALAVITGPGSFTGLRVSLATIKGLAHALNKPVITMNALEVVARISGPSTCTCVMLDAHRGEVFTQLFAVNDMGIPQPLSEVLIISLDSFLTQVSTLQQDHGVVSVIFTGDGVVLHQEKIVNYANQHKQTFQISKFLTSGFEGWILNPINDFLAPEASRYAYEKWAQGELSEAAQVNAYYIRPAEAEIKLKLGLLGKKQC